MYNRATAAVVQALQYMRNSGLAVNTSLHSHEVIKEEACYLEFCLCNMLQDKSGRRNLYFSQNLCKSYLSLYKMPRSNAHFSIVHVVSVKIADA